MDQLIRPLILLTQQQFEGISQEYFYGQQESICFAAKVRKIRQNGSEDTRYLVITVACIYVIRSRYGKGIPADEFNLVDIQKISYIQPNIVTFTTLDGKHSVPLAASIKSEYAQTIAQTITILNLVSDPSYNKENITIESTPVGQIHFPTIKGRIPEILQIRTMQLAHKFGNRISFDALSCIVDWDKNPNGPLKLTSSCNFGLTAKPFIHALAMETSLKSLILNDFANSQLSKVLKAIFLYSKSLIKLSIDEYQEPPSSAFDLISSYDSKISEISFKSCHTSVIFTILNGLKSFQGRIKVLTISQSKLTSDDFRNLFEILCTYPCFLSLTNLRIEDGAGDGIVIDDLSEFLTNSLLTIISISRSSHDITTLLNSIFLNSKSIRSVNSFNGRLFNQLSADIFVPITLRYIDISKSQVSTSAFGNFMKLLLTTRRHSLLTLNLSDLATSGSSEEIIKCFNVPDCQPILAELIYAGNEMQPDDVRQFIPFLKRQKYLRHLNLSRCFKIEIDESLGLLADYIIESKLPGFELNSVVGNNLKDHMTRFIESLIDKSSLETLIIEKSGMGDSGLDALRRFVLSNETISSISCDGSNPQTMDTFVSAYQTFIKCLDRIQNPKSDVALFGKKETLPIQFNSLIPPKTLNQRVVEYEQLDFSQPQRPVNSLLNLMDSMSTSILNKSEDNIVEENDMVQIFKDSIISNQLNLQSTNEASKSPEFWRLLSDYSNPTKNESE